jgi:hypothetical protein
MAGFRITKQQRMLKRNKAFFMTQDIQAHKLARQGFFLSALLLLCVAGLGACSTNPATGDRQFTALMSPQQENKVGASEHEKIIQQFGLYKDPALQAYVNQIGSRLAKNTERPDVRYQFFVLDSPIVNAFALPGDLYVNDAFSTAHRAHASTEGLAHALPCAAGLLMEEELKALEMALENPASPVAAIVGGSKISTKLDVLNNLAEKVDYLILGGGMANTFLNAQGADVGNSLCEKDMADEARKIMDHASKNNCEIVLPVDCVAVTEINANAQAETVSTQSIPEDRMAIDIGPQSIEKISGIIKQCKTVVWNGPMGVFEIKPFDTGTNAVAQTVAKATKDGDLVSIAGGGDTVAALGNAGAAQDFTYISTAGGAFLEWLEGKTLPGVKALEGSV